MKALLILVFPAALLLCGCEDDGGTTVNEAQDIIVGSNSQVIVVSGNTGTITVDQTTSADQEDPSIYALNNTGRVYIVSHPAEAAEEPEEVEP
jgi:uncharacterized protein YcfL